MMNDFVNELKQALVDEMATTFDEDVYIDKEGLGGGDHFNEALATAICHSLCMIAVYVPKYETHPFCLREYRAMEILEQRRMKLVKKSKLGNKGMIIPIVLRGVEDLPEDISKRVHYLDFSKYTTASVNIRKNEEYVSEIRKIAASMHELYKALRNIDPCADCESFSLPEAAEVKPLRHIGELTASPYPGSEDAE
jgi:hypothetical protein